MRQNNVKPRQLTDEFLRHVERMLPHINPDGCPAYTDPQRDLLREAATLMLMTGHAYAAKWSGDCDVTPGDYVNAFFSDHFFGTPFKY